MEYKTALVREPGNNYTGCLSSHPLHHTVSLIKAREQHKKYRDILTELGLDVIIVPRDDDHPDSCFIEDNAIVYNEKALICRMAKESRRGEQLGVAKTLDEIMTIKWASEPATIEGGDVVHTEKKLISGITDRTNLEGIKQMKEWLNIKVDTIFDPSIMHLKSYVTYLGQGIMIATEKYSAHPALEGFKILIPPRQEEYAADTLTIGDTVIMVENHPQTQLMIREEGFEIISMNVSEFEKCDGALTCLSILI
jgi:dimethylargininase